MNSRKTQIQQLAGILRNALVALGLTMAFLTGCGEQTAERPDTSPVAEASVQEEQAVYQETDQDISVTLTTDKQQYEAGEPVRFTLEIRNDRKGWTISGKKFRYTNQGLIPLQDDSCPDELPMLRSGESCSLEGVLTGGTVIEETAAAGDGDVNFRPYVRLTYGGEEVMIRCVLNLKLTQVVESLGADAKAAQTVSVHDPTIFRDKDGKYYLVGTHITAASSDDLLNWKGETGVFRKAMSKETIEQIRAYNLDDRVSNWFDYLWAPDIIWNEAMQKYCVYLSANGDAWKSNIVLLTADSVLGPYDYAGSVVYGGFDEKTVSETDVLRVLGTDSLPERYLEYGVGNRKWGDEYPNCIDPCVFYDGDGRLWMSYGSWSGGIFLLELDEQTGLRDETVTYETNAHSDAYFGTKIAGGKYVSGEGSFVQKIGDWYYLFMSYGNLEAAGGYNIRIFRSQQPDGPYLDELGQSPLYDEYVFNYNLGIGERLMGGYKWPTMTTGQVAQGHNSAFTDEDGRSYIVYHTRTNNGSEGHYVKVHQLFSTRDGWLLAAPYQTSGEKLPEQGLAPEEITGNYSVIVHELEIDYKALETKTAKAVTLQADGTVTGDLTGSWTQEAGTPYVDLMLEGRTYTGVALRMNIENSTRETTVFTLLGEEDQITVWGSRNE